MQIDNKCLNDLSDRAKQCPRLRISCDLRTTVDDNSQRVLNALEPGTCVPIHRHRDTAETVIVLRGSLKEFFFNDNGEVTEEFLLQAGGECIGIQIPVGQWHSIEVLESGTVIFEGKDGAYAPLTDEDTLF